MEQPQLPQCHGLLLGPCCLLEILVEETAEEVASGGVNGAILHGSKVFLVV